MELSNARHLVEMVRTVDAIASTDHLNAALALTMHAVRCPFAARARYSIAAHRVKALLEAHAAVVLTATHAFYVANTDAMLEVEKALSRFIRTQVKLASNSSAAVVSRSEAHAAALERAVVAAGFVVSEEYARVLDRTKGVEVAR